MPLMDSGYYKSILNNIEFTSKIMVYKIINKLGTVIRRLSLKNKSECTIIFNNRTKNHVICMSIKTRNKSEIIISTVMSKYMYENIRNSIISKLEKNNFKVIDIWKELNELTTDAYKIKW